MVQYEPALAPLMEDIDTLVQHPENANNGDVEAIMESIEVNGMYRPIMVAKETREIVAGNHTWAACKELGATQIPVVWLEGDAITALRRMVGDNRIASMARLDYGQMENVLEQIRTHDIDAGLEQVLLGTGYREADLDQIHKINEMPPDLDSDYASWPLMCFQVPPHVKNGFMAMTDEAGDERERFELLMRLAGWDGKA